MYMLQRSWDLPIREVSSFRGWNVEASKEPEGSAPVKYVPIQNTSQTSMCYTCLSPQSYSCSEIQASFEIVSS